MEIKTTSADNITEIKITGGIYSEDADALRQEFNRILQTAAGLRGVIVDISQINYFCSMMLGVFAQFAMQLKTHNAALRVVNNSSKVKTFIDITNLGNIVSLCSSVKEARDSLKA